MSLRGTAVAAGRGMNPLSLRVATASLFVGLTVAFVAQGSTGCSAIERQIDCSQICSRYADCYDSKYDQSGCRDRCNSAAAKDANYFSKVQQCDDCIGDKSCTSAAFKCAAPCASIVP